MSEYQYYEFQAIDRPLGEADRAELQTLSSRARVTSTSFTNHYLRLFYLLWLTAAEAGDLSDDEKELLPGIGPLTAVLDVFADFFHVDPDLVRASAPRPPGAGRGGWGCEGVLGTRSIASRSA